MSLLLVAAVVLAALNVGRIAAAGWTDTFGLLLNVPVLLVGGVLLFVQRNEVRR